MISKTGNKGPGFTLLEVLIAVTLLSMGLIGVLRAYATTTGIMEQARYDMNALYLLKTAKAHFEEKAITEGLFPGDIQEPFSALEKSEWGIPNADPWRWSCRIKKLDLLEKNTSREFSERSAPEKKTLKDLCEMELVVRQPDRSPVREIGLATYVRTEHAAATA